MVLTLIYLYIGRLPLFTGIQHANSAVTCIYLLLFCVSCPAEGANSIYLNKFIESRNAINFRILPAVHLLSMYYG